ncbi:hypothetical protein F66182_9258 [Fusarium sp. NRRL 66182]|nr:hypothetical protein F66182_9258 [Fusarium sp. NRRL 66182]
MATQHGPPSPSLSLPLEPRLKQLPFELIQAIANSLSRQAFQSFRLSSRLIAECTRPQLALANFDGVPWRKDGKRLKELSLIPSCARRIRSVKFNMARMVEEEVEYATSRITNAYELSRRWGPYLTTQGVFNDLVELPLDLVIPALMRLPNLDTVCLTWATCPWEAYRDIDDVFMQDESVDMAGDEIVETQQAVLEALRKRSTPLKSLTFEPLMHPDLVLPSIVDDKVSTVFGSVTQLHLMVDYGVDIFKPDRLDYFISLMPNVRDLRVHVWPVELEAEDIDFYITNKLRHLEKIDLSCLHFNFVNFAHFIESHGSTLKDVKMQSLYGWCDPFQPAELDWDMIFNLMGEKLEVLETIDIQGTFSDNVGWHQMFFRNIAPDAWDFVSFMGEKSDRLEEFILEGGEYPRPTWKI